jgi:hypothetical protein
MGLRAFRILPAIAAWALGLAACDAEAHPTDGGGDAAGPSDCSDVPQCGFACPDGLVNPVDGRGCEHSCECVRPGGSAGSLRFFHTCGDPACRGHTGTSGVPACTSEAAGDACRIEDERCDPEDECNRLLVCASSDPTLSPGGCPISRRRYKAEIDYLDRAELARVHDALLAIRLATWRYRHDPAKQRLGFIIDDDEISPAVDALRDQVDLYGYTSMAVAAIQLQAAQIAELRSELAALERKLDRARRQAGP